MSFKLNLKAKIRLDTLLKRLLSTIRDKPGRRWLDKGLVRELLGITGFKNIHVRDLELYVHPLEDEWKLNGGNVHTFEPITLFDKKTILRNEERGF